MAESNNLMKIVSGFRERVTKGIKTITSDHALIHEHKGYSVFKTSTAIAASSYIDIQINTSTSVYGHLKIYEAAGTDSLFQFKIIEATSNSTFATGTTQITIWNRHRVNSSSYSSTFVCFSNPTYVSTTNTNNNLLESFYIGSTGTNQTRMGSARGMDNEFILKQNSTYILRLENLAAATGQGSLFAYWYEEDDA